MITRTEKQQEHSPIPYAATGMAQSNFAENTSTAQRGPHDRSGVAISRQE
jgi:hypothetical protein